MELYKITKPFNMYAEKDLPYKEFKKTNLLTLRIYQYGSNPLYYEFGTHLPTMNFTEEIKEELNILLKNEGELQIDNCFISFTTEVINKELGDIKLYDLSIGILRILFKYKCFNSDTFFAMSYDDSIKRYHGSFTGKDIKNL